MAKFTQADTGNYMELVHRSCNIMVNDGTSAANKAMEITARLVFPHYSYNSEAAKQQFLSHLDSCQLCITPDAGSVAHKKERANALKSWDAAIEQMEKFSNFMQQIGSQGKGAFFETFFKGAMEKTLEPSLEVKEDELMTTPLLDTKSGGDDEVTVSGQESDDCSFCSIQ